MSDKLHQRVMLKQQLAKALRELTEFMEALEKARAAATRQTARW